MRKRMHVNKGNERLQEYLKRPSEQTEEFCGENWIKEV